MNGSRSGGFAPPSVPAAYERFMLRQLFEPWAEELVGRAGLRPVGRCSTWRADWDPWPGWPRRRCTPAGAWWPPTSVRRCWRERRVARPGGVTVVSTWAAERPLGLFGPMCETMSELGLAEPYPRAFHPGSYRLGAAELASLLQTAGWHNVEVETVELSARWDSADDAAGTILGTPYAPLVASLAAADRERLRTPGWAGRVRALPSGP